MSQRAHFFLYIAGPGLPMRTFLKVIARTDHKNLTVLFSQRHKPHLANCHTQKCLIAHFFVIARDRRIAPPSQAGFGFGSGSVGQDLFYSISIPREMKLRRKKGPTSWGVISKRPARHRNRNHLGQQWWRNGRTNRPQSRRQRNDFCRNRGHSRLS